jgi:hypothetical protein
MTLDEFIAGAPAQLLTFKVAVLEAAKTDSTFPLVRSETDWWMEVLAYIHWMDLESRFVKD